MRKPSLNTKFKPKGQLKSELTEITQIPRNLNIRQKPGVSNITKLDQNILTYQSNENQSQVSAHFPFDKRDSLMELENKKALLTEQLADVNH